MAGLQDGADCACLGVNPLRHSRVLSYVADVEAPAQNTAGPSDTRDTHSHEAVSNNASHMNQQRSSRDMPTGVQHRPAPTCRPHRDAMPKPHTSTHTFTLYVYTHSFCAMLAKLFTHTIRHNTRNQASTTRTCLSARPRACQSQWGSQ